tara:strand:+ start:11032 stop:12189 length:1158 start_codon:yes stop_codon:yes gene_type:complete
MKYELKEEINQLKKVYGYNKITEIIDHKTIEFLKKSKLSNILSINKREEDLLSTTFKVCKELGKTDLSLGWIVGVSNSAWPVLNFFNHKLNYNANLEENNLLSMVLGKPAKLQRLENNNGWMLNGHWKYASNVENSSYFVGLAMEDDKEVHMVVIPSEKLNKIEGWKCAGLKGSVSITVEVKDYHITSDSTLNYKRINGIPPENTLHDLEENIIMNPYADYFSGVLMNCLTGSVLGATESAFELLLQLKDYPVVGTSYKNLISSGCMRSKIGSIYNQLQSLNDLAFINTRIIDEKVRQNKPPLSIEERIQQKYRAHSIMKGCAHIIQSILWLYGANGLHRENPFEKIWRDINTATLHGGFSKETIQDQTGSYLLGGNPYEISNII